MLPKCHKVLPDAAIVTRIVLPTQPYGVFNMGFLYHPNNLGLSLAGMQSFGVGNVEKSREFKSDSSIRVFYKDYTAICFKSLLLVK